MPNLNSQQIKAFFFGAGVLLGWLDPVAGLIILILMVWFITYEETK